MVSFKPGNLHDWTFMIYWSTCKSWRKKIGLSRYGNLSGETNGVRYMVLGYPNFQAIAKWNVYLRSILRTYPDTNWTAHPSRVYMSRGAIRLRAVRLAVTMLALSDWKCGDSPVLSFAFCSVVGAAVRILQYLGLFQMQILIGSDRMWFFKLISTLGTSRFTNVGIAMP